MRMRLRHLIGLVVLAAVLLASAPVHAQGMKVIRDDEIEDTLHVFARPIFEQAGLSPANVRII